MTQLVTVRQGEAYPTLFGVELGVRKHLTEEEHERFRPAREWPGVEPLTQIPLSDLEAADLFRSLRSARRRYVLLLACLQRLRLPLDVALACKIVRKEFPLGELPNFQYLDALIQHHYGQIFPMKAKNRGKMQQAIKDLHNAAVSLWCAGYALKPGLGGQETVTGDLIERARQPREAHAVSLITIREMLAREPDTLVERTGAIPYDQAERRLWSASGLFPPATPLEASIAEFIFSSLRQQVSQVAVEDRFDDSGNLVRRTGKQRIAQRTWRQIAWNLRFLLLQCRSHAVADLTESSLAKAYTISLKLRTTQDQRSVFRIAFLYWLKWYKRTCMTGINLERIAPRPKRVTRKGHGRVFSAAKAHTLIRTLLDDGSPLFSESDLMDFRCRRACLLILASAARPSEVLRLLPQAMCKDQEGRHWIRFHRTKTKRNNPDRSAYEWIHSVPVKEDAVRWFNELLAFAPAEAIEFPIERDGDGLTERRLLANRYNNSQASLSSLHNWLRHLQERLWPGQDGTYFTPHNLRALHLTYRRIIGDPDVLLERQAGHSRPESKLPYTMTMPAEEVAKFGDILEEGVWNLEVRTLDVTDNQDEGAISVEGMARESSRFTVTPRKLEEAQQLVEEALEAVTGGFGGTVIEPGVQLPALSVGAYTHNCNAPMLLNCGHTPGHCRACEHYKPDGGTAEQHRAEVFLEMLYYFDCLRAEKEFKATGKRTMIFQKSQDLKARLDRTGTELWTEKFQMSPADAKKLHRELWTKAKSYHRQYGPVKPRLSNDQILHYLATGEVD